MGGTVLELKVKPGDAVKVGDTLLVYEAMKMENNLVSDRARRGKPFPHRRRRRYGHRPADCGVRRSSSPQG